jgi:hypothetical protein
LSFEGGSCGSQYVVGTFWEEEIEVIRRQRRRRKKLLDDLKDIRGYFHLKEEAVDRIMWRDRFGKRR